MYPGGHNKLQGVEPRSETTSQDVDQADYGEYDDNNRQDESDIHGNLLLSLTTISHPAFERSTNEPQICGTVLVRCTQRACNKIDDATIGRNTMRKLGSTPSQNWTREAGLVKKAEVIGSPERCAFDENPPWAKVDLVISRSGEAIQTFYVCFEHRRSPAVQSRPGLDAMETTHFANITASVERTASINWQPSRNGAYADGPDSTDLSVAQDNPYGSEFYATISHGENPVWRETFRTLEEGKSEIALMVENYGIHGDWEY